MEQIASVAARVESSSVAFLDHAQRARYQVRSRASEKTEAFDDDAPEIPVRAAQNGWMEVRDLEKALKRLPGEQREILLLVGLEQTGYEVARA